MLFAIRRQVQVGHASVLNAAQCHGDFVLIDCPANCLQALGQNDHGWDQGQLFYTPDRVWGMPPDYSQQMAAENHLPNRVASEVQSPGDDLDVTATQGEILTASKGEFSGRTRLVLKVVNAGDSPHVAEIRAEGYGNLDGLDSITTLQGGYRDENSATIPERIGPIRGHLEEPSGSLLCAFPARSYTIVRLSRLIPARSERQPKPDR